MTRQFICEFCYKVCTTGQALSRHWVVHTGEKSFECGLCKKMFARKDHLNRHRQRCESIGQQQGMNNFIFS